MVTYERNVGENEVSLNGTTFKLLGPVRTTLASAYPEKQITGGDYSADSHPWASIHDWNDFSEGFGVDRMVIGKHDRRSFFSTADGSTPFHLVKRPWRFRQKATMW